MDGIKYAVFTEKSIRLLGNNQYTSNVESGSTRTEIKHWIELLFGVKVIAMNSHRLPVKGRRMGPIMGHTMHYRRMIITLQPDIGLLRIRRNGQWLTVALMGGFAIISNNEITILGNDAEISTGRIREYLAEASIFVLADTLFKHLNLPGSQLKQIEVSREEMGNMLKLHSCPSSLLF
ncbi:hypothetical protein KSP40_PGU018421 [Platanthera guangdongensis]|uniref:50S ribosomal protein L23, chloroplastic n=1 Tax=Platanthera guangdongensis TaxID=2320717 RepID=A0ABR2LUR9_9ASPA